MKVISNACMDLRDDDDFTVSIHNITRAIHAPHKPTAIAPVINKWETILCGVSPE